MTDLLTITEACALLQVTDKTFRKMVRSGEFPELVRRGPRFVRVKKKDVEDFIAKLLDRRAATE